MSRISYADALQGKPKPMFQILDEIREIIRCSIERIIQGYIVRHQEADGCDEYGFKYWVDCDLWSGRSWDLDEAMRNAFSKNTSNFINNGVKIGNKTHYLNPRMYYQNWTSTRDFQKFKVELLPEDEIEVTQQNVEKIRAIGEKIDKEVHNFFKKDKTPFEACRIHSKISTIFDNSIRTSPEDFWKSIEDIDKHNFNCDKQLNNIKKMSVLLDDSERQFLGIEDSERQFLGIEDSERQFLGI
jgi:hypothetical protein